MLVLCVAKSFCNDFWLVGIAWIYILQKYMFYSSRLIIGQFSDSFRKKNSKKQQIGDHAPDQLLFSSQVSKTIRRLPENALERVKHIFLQNIDLCQSNEPKIVTTALRNSEIAHFKEKSSVFFHPPFPNCLKGAFFLVWFFWVKCWFQLVWHPNNARFGCFASSPMQYRYLKNKLMNAPCYEDNSEKRCLVFFAVTVPYDGSK